MRTAYLSQPKPKLSGAIVIHSAREFRLAMRAAKAGQTFEVLRNVRIDRTFAGWNRVIHGGVVNVVFDPGAGFVGSPKPDHAAVFVRGSGGWRIWGGTITNLVGGGLRFYSLPGPFTWTGFVVGQTADSGVAVYPVGGDITHLTLVGRSGSSSQNLAFDPHQEKGTGLHAWNIADANGGYVSDSTFATSSVDQATGAAVEVRTDRIGSNVVLYASARHLGFALRGTSWTGDAQSQVAGNVVQLWDEGGKAGSLDIRYAEGNDIQGRILDTHGCSGDLSSVRLDYGRAAGPILQNPRLSRVAYLTKNGLRLGEVQPLP
ncbi:MAG TPA: hypothetical protein VNH40_02025 [Gaiellaceae bacterium]|nr:hypothetical protein [Gaiellaceae bacterium]